jgi:hypothetical protein
MLSSHDKHLICNLQLKDYRVDINSSSALMCTGVIGKFSAARHVSPHWVTENHYRHFFLYDLLKPLAAVKTLM